MGNWEQDTLKEIMAVSFPICKQMGKKMNPQVQKTH